MSAPKPNFLERTIAFVAPQTALRRAAAHDRLTEFGYNSAVPGFDRGRSGGQSKNAASESWRAQRDRINIMWDARDAENNFCFIGGILHRVATYVCSKIDYQPNTGVPEADVAYKTYFDGICAGGNIDITGRHTLRKLVEMAFRGMLRDGDAGFVLVKKGGGIKVQSIEADRIGKPNEAMHTEKYIGGLSINEFGAVESYRVYDRSRTAMYVNPREVKPQNFIHLFDPIRSDQYRGVSVLQSALPHARHLYEWFQMEWQAGKHASSYAGFFQSKDPHATRGSAAWTGKTADGTPTMDAVIGKLVKLGEGDSVTFAPGTNRPTGSFMAFVSATIREIAIGLDLPYGFIYNLADLGGVTARIEVKQAQRAIDHWRELLVDQVLSRIKDAVLAYGIAQGHIPAVPNFRSGKWSFGAALTGDVGYQTNADVSLVNMGLKAGGDLTNELHGEEFKDVARRNAMEVKVLQGIAAETGVPVEMIAPQRFPNGTNQLASMQPPPPPPPGLVNDPAVGEKGAKQLVDILQGVSEGTMEREAAVESIIAIYGIERTLAEKMIPEKAIVDPEPDEPEPPAPNQKPSPKK